MNYNLELIASQFELEGTIQSVKPLGQGFINDTFIITVDSPAKRYILQRKNKNIFTDVPAMMQNIKMVCDHIKAKVSASGGDHMREAMTVIETKDGKLCYESEDGEFWAVCLFIEDTKAYDSSNTPELAYQGGKGIGKFQSMLADFNGELADILPGFHNIRFRYEQWNDAISRDAAGRVADLGREISWIESRKAEMLDYWSKVENGEIPKRVSHNDTKINNILFDNNGNVLCVIDLDTVLGSTCLNDFGDAIRTYANTGTEDDLDLDKVSLSLSQFEGYTRGYLSEAASFMNDTELEYLAFSAKYITYEQVLRFLMDYINGDTYYKIKSPKHNLERTYAQYKLLQSMEQVYPQMCEIVKKVVNENK